MGFFSTRGLPNSSLGFDDNPFVVLPEEVFRAELEKTVDAAVEALEMEAPDETREMKRSDEI